MIVDWYAVVFGAMTRTQKGKWPITYRLTMKIHKDWCKADQTTYYFSKVWSSRDFKLVKVLFDHESQVTSVDVVAEGQSVATVSHNRTIKLWSRKNVERQKNNMYAR